MTSLIFRALRRASLNLHAGILLGLADSLGFPRWAVKTRFGRRPPEYLADLTRAVGATKYSRSAFELYRPLARTKWPLFLLASIPGQVEGKLLVMGPRFESEFYLARGLGWSRHSLFGLDLLTYSPYVTVGDMHQMPFADDWFHSIVCGWTLSYSFEPEMVASEIVRVLKAGGIVVFGVHVELDDSTSDLNVPKGDLRIQTRIQFERLLPTFECIACFAPVSNGNLLIAMRKPL